MNALSLPKRELGVLVAHVPELRASLDAVMSRRARANIRAGAA
jgi:hypothetical protein